MKINKILVLAGVLLLPAQELLAGNVREMALPSVNKSVIAVPSGGTRFQKPTLPNRKAVKSTIAEPSGRTKFQKPTLPNRRAVIAGLGPNLTVSVRNEHDVCAYSKSPLGEGIYDATCDLIITVKNVGDTATSLPANGAFRLDLFYFKHDGEIRKKLHYIGNLRANESKTIIYPSSSLRSYKASTSFTATVDRNRVVAETNENDNRAVFWIGR